MTSPLLPVLLPVLLLSSLPACERTPAPLAAEAGPGDARRREARPRVADGSVDRGAPGKLGELCHLPGPSGRIALVTSALDCESKLCLYYSEPGVGKPVPLCTKLCQTDGDCAGLSGLCTAGFACGVAQEVGPAACCRMCICKELLAGAAPDPPACAGRSCPL